MAFVCLAPTAPLRRSSVESAKNPLFYLLLLLITSGSVGDAIGHDISNDTKYICSSMDIRNSLEKFKMLENCTVIEGFLQILLFDNVNHTDLSKIEFPHLTEITDYLLMYRVNGLRSVGQLFPNLSVIRGQNKFLGTTALTIFEMSSLQEIGLYSLTEITRGAVHIDKNPSLCFVRTINWDLIARDDKNFIQSLKPENECPVCSSAVKHVSSGNKSIHISCPKAPKTNNDGFEKEKYLCWNKHHCQKECPDKCNGSCNDHGRCCNESCISCTNEDPNVCIVCRNLTMGEGKDKRCMSKCPKGHYRYLDRRCISKRECIDMDKPIELISTIDVEKPYKIFENESCVLYCPSNYMADNQKHECKPCGGRCTKECDGVNIDSITIAKQLRGCTKIKGPLEIQIRGGANVVSELEDNLSMIEEITGYLKIVRSFSLVSLNFFKSLTKIRGDILDSNKYVFSVLDNQNLQELWSDNRTVQIGNGKLFFHFNPKLCYYKILNFSDRAKLPAPDDLEVAKNSNGDKIACRVKKLLVNITVVEDKQVVLEWNKFSMDDQRKLLAYTIYWIEAPHQNITEYDRRDACGLDDWHVYDVGYQEQEEKISRLLPNLKPYTQYALYVKTYTIASEPNGAKSDIRYFTTLPSTPTPPQNLRVTSSTSESLFISWSPPAYPNGNISHYIVSGKRQIHSYMYSKERNYCKDPIVQEGRQVTITTVPPKTNDTCRCDGKGTTRMLIDESEEVQRIKFEDELQNQVYQKRQPDQRRKRETTGENNTFPDNYSQNIKPNTVANITDNGTGTWQSFRFIVRGNEFYIDKLHHYSLYEIKVEACQNRSITKDKDSNCSVSADVTHRTLLKSGADNISKVVITNKSLDTVTISWDQPEDPNGVILTYTVEYHRVDIEHASFYCIVAKNATNRTMSHTLTQLLPGNYSLRVMATSSAANGAYSQYVYFDIAEPSSNAVLIICLILFIFSCILIFGGWLFKKHQKEKENLRLIQSVNPEYVPSVYVPDEWEVPRDKIELIKELGQGSFGMVWEGLAKDVKGKSSIKCAVKTVNEHATNRERLEFLNEASVMKAFDTAHVVRLLGVVSQGQPTLVIMELMAHGDLKSYLRSHRPDVENYDPTLRGPPNLKQILQMAIEIADGMAYLSAKKFVHRDLAARNCMVSEELTVKIGDFGMTRDIYETDYYRKGTKGLLPVRWMAPESLKDGVFTSNSDVWSYGVVLWEMATLASQPYQGLSNDQVLRYVIDGGVMERPENCPDKLYTLMRYCWQPKPSSRPNFLKLCQLLLDDASAVFAQVSFYNSPAGVEARSTRPTPSPSHTDDPSVTPLRKSGDRLPGYTPSNSQNSDELDIDTHHQFPSISEGVVAMTTVNGYVSGCPTNNTTTPQC